MRAIAISLFAVVFVFASSPINAADPAPPDEQARFIAGMPLRGTTLDSLAQSSTWTNHAASFDNAWRALEKRQLAPIQGWMTQHFPEAAASSDPLLYMFSGPDFLYANAFFPNASTFVLCGIEPIGQIPDVAKISRESLHSALYGMQKSLDSVLNFSFFITKQMKSDLQNTRLSGTLPVLYVFLARSGCRIDDVKMVTIAADGTLSEGSGPTPGVRIKFTRGTHPQQTVYYFSTDLADYAVPKGGFLIWLESLGSSRSFAKAASYLMHGSNFTKIRKQLLDQCTFIIEDDSGIPVKNFDDQWKLEAFGNYVGPIPIFSKFPQPLLWDLYRRTPRSSLPFSFGYRWHPSESTLIAATRKGPIPVKPKAVAPAATPAAPKAVVPTATPAPKANP